VNRRFLAFLVVLAIAFQGPSIAYAEAIAAKTAPPTCGGHVLGHTGNGDSCCPQGILPGLCCAGGLALAALPSSPITLPLLASHLMPVARGSVPVATERPTPLLRPPIA
jgi:hypothetical protein